MREDVAMTGEITLSGLVLPVGGIREKALAARRHGIKTFILPARNEPDLAELPPEVRRDMKFVPVATLEEALKVALPQDSAGVIGWHAGATTLRSVLLSHRCSFLSAALAAAAPQRQTRTRGAFPDASR